REVLLGDRVHEARRGPADVRLRRVLLGSLEPGLRQHRARQLLTQADVVARRQGRDALREVRRQEALLARTAVGHAPGDRDGGEEQARVGAARAPGGGSAIVEHLAIGGVLLAGDRDGVGERQGGRNRLLGNGDGRAGQEPGGAQHVSHANPWAGREVATEYAPRPQAVSTTTRAPSEWPTRGNVRGCDNEGQAAGRRSTLRRRAGISIFIRRPSGASQRCTSPAAPPVTVTCRSVAGSRFSVVAASP